MDRDRVPPSTFRAKLYKVGINRCVDVPATISAFLGAHNHIPVKGKVRGLTFHTTLVPRGQGRHRLFIHSRIWRVLRLDVGQSILVTLSRDLSQQPVELPLELQDALPSGSFARAAFEAQTETLKRGFIDWILRAKGAATRERRLVVGIERLIERYERKCKRSRP